jgi:hypothetical protein
MLLLDGQDFTTAQEFADDVIRKRTNNMQLLDPRAPWRAKPSTEKQQDTLKRYGVPFIARNLTAGMAADLLDTVFLTRIARRA